MSYNFRKEQLEKLKFATKTNLAWEIHRIQGPEFPPKGSNINNL